jgi:plastocyanin
MRHATGKCALAIALLMCAATSWAANHVVVVGLGNDVNPVYVFSPADLTINVGDTVTFKSTGGALGPHNVHADDDSFRCSYGCDGDGHNGNGNPHLFWQVTLPFDHVGTIPYHCDRHVGMGMRGVIRVVQGSGPSGTVPITAGFTGAWYDPNQAGHGIFIEVLGPTQMLAWWFTFTPTGEQAWFGNVGTIDGDTATVRALKTEGGRWIPNFDPAEVTQPEWGTLTFKFTDCNHGHVDFSDTAPGSGFGQGGMDLTRLTQPEGLSCP